MLSSIHGTNEHNVWPYVGFNVPLNYYIFIRSQVDWNAENGQYNLLQYACEMGRHGIAGYLLDNGARYDEGCLDSKSTGYYSVFFRNYKVYIKIEK